MIKFIPGMQLSELFFHEVVEKILNKSFPRLKYSAGLIGKGSEILGVDTPISRDHDWGPRVMIFLKEKDFFIQSEVADLLRKELPASFKSYPTKYRIDKETGVTLMSEVGDKEKTKHRVEFYTSKSFFEGYLGVDTSLAINDLRWLVLSQQKLKTIKEGKFFLDQLDLKRFQDKFRYYPQDIWFYLIALEWYKVSYIEAFLGRTGDVGDELGSRLIASQLVQYLMNLCFLMEKQYIPYSKWFGTFFARLKIGSELEPVLKAVLAATDWKIREKKLVQAYEIVAQLHNELKITKPLHEKAVKFHNRPYLVISGAVFAKEITKKIKNKTLRNLNPDMGLILQTISETEELKNICPMLNNIG